MTDKLQLVPPREVRETAVPALDLVIPVTTPALTRSTIRTAERLALGLHAQVRLIRIQLVPFPLEIAEPPVSLQFLREQLEHYGSKLPIRREIRLARDLRDGLMSVLRPGSVVMLASKRRPWRTGQERLATLLRRAGHTVILTFEGDSNA